jgi:hypothetical protein
MDFTQFLPKDTYSWSLLACLIFTLGALLMFSKGVMKCKETIEQYVIETRNAKAYYDKASEFIAYCQAAHPETVKGYLDDTNQSEIEFITALSKYGDDNA